jgi:hypothetical protein
MSNLGTIDIEAGVAASIALMASVPGSAQLDPTIWIGTRSTFPLGESPLKNTMGRTALRDGSVGRYIW